MPSFRLSRQAKKSLINIFSWTVTNFGSIKAVEYKDQLIGRLKLISANELVQGRPCSLLIEGCFDKNFELFYYLEGRHYIIYGWHQGELVVVDFVHGACDLVAILEFLTG